MQGHGKATHRGGVEVGVSVWMTEERIDERTKRDVLLFEIGVGIW